MSSETNKAIVRRLVEQARNQRDLNVVDELFASTYVQRGRWPEGTGPRGMDGFKQEVSMELAAFPDLHNTIEDMVAEGDKVATRWVARGTHQGELLGVAPTGKEVTWTGISIIRIESGKITELWGEHDGIGFARQLGMFPPQER